MVAAPSRTKNRALQAERTRLRRANILAAASDLFVRDGYLQTTMADIAREAGVAVQTLYLSFRSKAAVLNAAFDVTLAGDDDPRPVLERPWHDRLCGQPDGRRALDVFIEEAANVISRLYSLYDVVRAAAADPEVAELLERNKRQRFESFEQVMSEVAAKPGFAEDLSVRRAAQVLYAALSEETYGLLVVEQGWDVTDWSQWVSRTVGADIFS